MNDTSLSLFVRVERKWRASETVAGFILADPHGRPLPVFSAGAHIDVRVSEGLVRQYSLCNTEADRDHYRIAVLREPSSRGGSTGMHDTLEEGDLVQISAPKNHFPLEPAKRTVLMAGGIGITPLLCMAERLAVSEAEFELHYCGRTRKAMAFLEDIEQAEWANRARVYIDDEGAQLAVADVAGAPDPDTHLYVCGPAGFIDHVLSTCRDTGWSSDQLHIEYFAGAVIPSGDSDSFEVQVASSGESFTVPADKTVYEVLRDNGIEIMVSCEQGVCGTCLTRVLDGTPDHRDLYMDDAEHAANDQFTPCCSRSLTPTLVLDI